MTNIWIGVGRLTRDPELRYAESGKAVAPMRIAVPRAGEGDDADFFDVVAFGQLAEACATHLTKGRQVLVEGTLRQQSWTRQPTPATDAAGSRSSPTGCSSSTPPAARRRRGDARRRLSRRPQHEGDGAAVPRSSRSAQREEHDHQDSATTASERDDAGAARPWPARRHALAVLGEHGALVAVALEVAHPGHQVGRCRRRRRARPVGHPVGDGRVGRMADRRPHRHGRVRRWPGPRPRCPSSRAPHRPPPPRAMTITSGSDRHRRPMAAATAPGAFGPAIGTAWRSSCHSSPDASSSVETSASPAVPGAVISPTRKGRPGTTRRRLLR